MADFVVRIVFSDHDIRKLKLTTKPTSVMLELLLLLYKNVLAGDIEL